MQPLLTALRDAIASNLVLEDQIHDLKLALGFDRTANVQSAFGVSESLARILVMLADGKPRTKEAIHAGLFYHRPEVDLPDEKIVDTLLCKLRKHIEPHGVEVSTIWGSGYVVTEGLDVVRAAVETGLIDPAAAARRRKLERERERYTRLRAQQKRKDRQTYLAQSLSRLKPWESEGVCRATWYERRRRQTGVLPSNDNTLVQARIKVAA